MADTQLSEFAAIFLEEGRQRLKDFSQSIDLMLLSAPDMDNCDKARIAIHTIKGMSSQMGYENIAAVSKAAEEYFVAVKNMNKMPLKQDLSVFKKTAQALENMFSALENTGADSGDASLAGDIKERINILKGE